MVTINLKLICNMRHALNTKEPGIISERFSNRYSHMLWWKAAKYDCFEQEVWFWKCFWSQSVELPSTFPFISKLSKLLKLLMLIPATAVTVERAQFLLKFVKNNMRSAISEDRMNVLILLYLHKIYL